MSEPLERWSEVHADLPSSGRHLLACYDAETVTVFAAHSHEIGAYAVQHGEFGGSAWASDRTTRFRLSLPRVMARSERGMREGKTKVLGITIRRERFDSALRQAVHWREFPDGLYQTKGQWRLATRYSQVVMDWAPDSAPDGSDLERYTVRFGVRAHLLKSFSSEWIVRVDDLGDLAQMWREDEDPLCPVMKPYPAPEPGLEARLLWEPEG